MFNRYPLPAILLSIVLFSGILSCTHDPFLDEGDDTNPTDSTGMGEPCDPNVVYFQLQVLPILRSNCAISGCHDAASATEGIILDSYDNVMKTGKIRPLEPSQSEIYEKITEDKVEKRMPPAPRNPLTADQINLISKWIQQGAKNLECDADGDICNTTDVSYSATILPVIQNNCQGCHSGSSPSGGVNLGSYAGIKAVADNGRLYGAVSWQAGFSKMPQGGAQLPSCKVDQFKAWIDAGAPQN